MAKIRTVGVEGKSPEEVYKNALLFTMKSQKLASIVVHSQTGTLAVLPRDSAERYVLGAYKGSGNLTNLLDQLYKHYDKQTILKIDERDDFNSSPEKRAEFKAIITAIAKGDVDENKEIALTDETQAAENAEPTEPTEPTEEEKLTAELTAELEALGSQASVSTDTAPEAVVTAEAPKKVKAAKEPKPPKEPKATKEPKPATPKHYETGLTNDGSAACRVCGKALTLETSIKRGIGPVCWAAIQGVLGYSDTQIADLANPEVTDEQAFLAKIAEARALLNAKSELTEPPEGYVKLADVTRECQKAEIPVSRWIKAFGGDRNAHEPEDAAFAPVYVGRTRYVPGDAFSVLSAKVAAEGESKRALAGAAKAAKEAADAKKAAQATQATQATQAA